MKKCIVAVLVTWLTILAAYALGLWWFSKPRASKYNLDRKDNSKGYSKDNCVVCCSFCNYTKGDRFTYMQFLKIGKLIRSFKNEPK